MYFVPSTWQRLLAKLVDLFGFGMLIVAGLWDQVCELVLTGQAVFTWVQVLFVIALVFLSEFLCYYFWAKTPGKWIFNLKLVNASDSEIEVTPMQIFERLLIQKFSILVSWAIYATALARYDRRHLPDLISGTRVVSTEPRESIARPRWAVAGIFMLYFMATGMQQFRTFCENSSFSRTGLEVGAETSEDDLGDLDFVE